MPITMNPDGSISYDGTEDSTGSDPTPIPAGTYDVVIHDHALKTTKAGTGQYIVMTLRVTSGSYEDRKIFDNLNVANPNPIAVAMANARLLKYTIATLGQQRFNDLDELLERPFKVRTKIKKTEQYADRTEVADVYRADGGKIQKKKTSIEKAAKEPVSQQPAAEIFKSPAAHTPTPTPAPTPTPTPSVPAVEGEPAWMREQDEAEAGTI